VKRVKGSLFWPLCTSLSPICAHSAVTYSTSHTQGGIYREVWEAYPPTYTHREAYIGRFTPWVYPRCLTVGYSFTGCV